MARSIRVVVLRGDDEILNKVYRGDTISFGKRETGNDVVLNAQGVSRKHATLERGSKGLILSDARSTNGTFVNAERIEKVILSGGEKITIGPFQVQVIDEAGSGGESESSSKSGSWVFEELQGQEEELQELIDHEPSVRLSLDELAPIEIPDAPEPEIDEPEPVSDRPSSAKRTLASIYREAARRCGAPDWGRPGHEPGNEVLTAIGHHLRETALSPEEQVEWYHRLSRELTGEGPLPSLLAETSFEQLTICGTDPIELHSGESSELLPIRYSCHEAIHADIQRIVGTRPQVGEILSRFLNPYQVTVIGSGLVDGPGVVVRRIDEGTDPELPEQVWGDALPYITGLIQQHQNILVCGNPGVDLMTLQKATIQLIPPRESLTIVQRGGGYRDSRSIRVDGFGESALTWRVVAQLHRQWLYVEEVVLGDIRALFTHGRGRKGGTVVTTTALTYEAALSRLEAFTVCGGVAGVEQAALAVRQLFDTLVYVQVDPDGASRPSSILEVRAGRQLVELFANEEGQLRPTGVESMLVQ